jgi:hypothetical protein
VYVHQTQPLDDGEEKHVISVFVADESGLINRVAGVFARRGKQARPCSIALLMCSNCRFPCSEVTQGAALTFVS